MRFFGGSGRAGATCRSGSGPPYGVLHDLFQAPSQDRDAEHFHDTILEAGSDIPPRPNRRRPHAYDKDLYKERNLVKRFFNKLKLFRRIATHYDKLLAENVFSHTAVSD